MAPDAAHDASHPESDSSVQRMLASHARLENAADDSADELSVDLTSSVCPYCRSVEILEVRSEGCYVCKDCGVDLSPIFDEHESLFVQGECDLNNSRLGPPIDPLLSTSSLSTTIQYNWKFRRLKQIHDRSAMTYTERSLYHAFTFIEKVMRDRLNLGKAVIDTAKCMYKDMKEKRISRGLIHKALTAACVYFACKVQNTHVRVKLTKQEVSSAFEVSTAKLNKACKIFRDLTKDKPYFSSIFESIHVSDIVVRMVGRLEWQNNIEKWNVIKVIRALDALLENYGCLDNKHISSILAAMIYLAASELDVMVAGPTGKLSKVTKNIICGVYDVTLITLNKTLRDIQSAIETHISIGHSLAMDAAPAAVQVDAAVRASNRLTAVASARHQLDPAAPEAAQERRRVLSEHEGGHARHCQPRSTGNLTSL